MCYLILAITIINFFLCFSCSFIIPLPHLSHLYQLVTHYPNIIHHHHHHHQHIIFNTSSSSPHFLFFDLSCALLPSSSSSSLFFLLKSPSVLAPHHHAFSHTSSSSSSPCLLHFPLHFIMPYCSLPLSPHPHRASPFLSFSLCSSSISVHHTLPLIILIFITMQSIFLLNQCLQAISGRSCSSLQTTPSYSAISSSSSSSSLDL